MKHTQLVVALFTVLSLNAGLALADNDKGAGPCKDKREAKHASRKTLHECIESWAKYNKADDKEPSGDCGDKLNDFVKASKELKSCHADHMKKK